MAAPHTRTALAGVVGVALILGLGAAAVSADAVAGQAPEPAPFELSLARGEGFLGRPAYTLVLAPEEDLALWGGDAGEWDLSQPSEPLLASLKAEADIGKRLRAACVLGFQRYKPAAPALIEVLREDVSGESRQYQQGFVSLRLAAVRAVGLIGDPAAVDALAGLVRSEAGAPCAWTIVGYMGGWDPLANRPPVQRRLGVGSLRLMGNADGVELLGPAAVRALGEIRSPRAVPVLLGLLSDEEYRHRGSAAWALGMIGGPEAEQGLRKAATGQTESYRLTGAIHMALARISSRGKKPDELLKDLDSDDTAVVVFAIRRLGELRSEAAVPALEKLARDPRTVSTDDVPGASGVTYTIAYAALRALRTIRPLDEAAVELAAMPPELRERLAAAEEGDPDAQDRLAQAYATGRGVAKDPAKAAVWYRKAADQGNVYAQGLLGLAYKYGAGVAKDGAEAARWYRKAAEQGDGLSAYWLGLLYERGDGVPEDLKEAAKWYRKAADHGNPEGMVGLAWLLATVPQMLDPKQSLVLAKEATAVAPNDANAFDTLACAQAANGDFDAAVEAERRAWQLTKDPERKQVYLERIAAFVKKMTYIELEKSEASK